jgi:hypothetical protein
MEAKRIREIVNEVNPPTKGKGMSITSELSAEIARTTPFWAALLRKRDLRDAEGGDEYVGGLLETFSRIYTALKSHGTQGILTALDLDTLYNLDAELQKNEMGLCDEYPALELVDVKSQGTFGAGTLMAYALLETAIAIVDSPKGQRQPEPAQTIGSVEENTLMSEVSEALAPAQSLVDDLMAGLPEEGSQPPPPAPGPQNPPPSTPLNTADLQGWAEDAHRAAEQMAAQPVFTLNGYATPDGYEIRGDVPPSLGAAARTFDLIYAIFRRDAILIPAKHGGLEFSIHIPAKIGGGRRP